MSVVKNILFSFIPFAVFGLFHGYAKPFYETDREMMLIMTAASIALICIILILQIILHDGNYFPVTVLSAFLFLSGILLFIPESRYAEAVSAGGIIRAVLGRPLFALFSAMFIMAVVPALFRRPFTFYFAKKSVPEAFWGTELFYNINLYINCIWAFIFAGSFAAQLVPDAAFQFGIPLFLQLGIGLPATKLLPCFLQKKGTASTAGTARIDITTAEAAVKGMPFVFNKSAAETLNITYQFKIHGDENFDGYVEIKNGSCSYHDGIHEAPDLTFISPADVYLKIARGELGGDTAFLQGLYRLEGNFNYVMLLNKIFSSSPRSSEIINKTDDEKNKDNGLKKTKYSKMKPEEIRKILVIQGSPRVNGTSKTAMLADAFIRGCTGAGAEAEIVNLREKRINHCTGCFTCWTMTPGICTFNDDAAEIMKKEQEADLVVYAWPLYHFGINSLLKKYIERTLPSIQPYLVKSDTGKTFHPVRKGFKEIKYAVLISVCGFPEISHFEPASMNFHYIADSGGEKGMNIVAEIYRPASEVIGNPFLKSESDRVLGLAEKAGESIVKNGFIGRELIDGIARVNIDIDEFRNMSNMSWDMCIKEGETLPGLQRKWGSYS